MFGMAAFNLFCGWLPTATNTVDLLSMLNFAVAATSAYIAGRVS
jgi:hypothetical protein